jgi:glycosyltransferase involved in cell wall biosynthesis
MREICLLMNPELSVVVPLRNEAPNVGPLSRQILEALRSQPRELELILVDDGSTDDTWSRILEARAADGRVRAVRHARSRGQSAALWTGFKASFGTVIATLDGDLQNDPADLPALLKELDACDMVCGVRAKRRDTVVRRVSSAVARLARRTALGVDFRDSGCNLRVFNRRVLEALPPFDGLHRFMPIIAHGAGASVKEMPVTHHPRVAGRTKYGIWNRLGRGIYDLAMVRWYLKRQIKTMGPAGMATEAETSALPGQRDQAR